MLNFAVWVNSLQGPSVSRIQPRYNFLSLAEYVIQGIADHSCIHGVWSIGTKMMLEAVSFGLQLSKWSLPHSVTAESLTGCSFHSPVLFAISHARRKVVAHTDDNFIEEELTSILLSNALPSTLLSSGIMFMSQPKGILQPNRRRKSYPLQLTHLQTCLEKGLGNTNAICSFEVPNLSLNSRHLLK